MEPLRPIKIMGQVRLILYGIASRCASPAHGVSQSTMERPLCEGQTRVGSAVQIRLSTYWAFHPVGTVEMTLLNAVDDEWLVLSKLTC